MSHKFESGFFVKEPAWHRLGTVLNNAPTIEQGIIEAGLDWKVVDRPVYWNDGDNNPIQATEYKALVRDSDNSTLGIVGKNYHPLQNCEAFNWFDFLLHEGNASLDAAGSLKKGKRVWVLAKINIEDVEVQSGDAVEPYLLLSNSHDGTMAVWIQFTPIRIVCDNTLTFALSRRYDDEKVGKAIKIRHSSTLTEQLSIARNSLNFARQKFEQSIAQYRAMARKQISMSEFDRYLEKVLDIDEACDHSAFEKIFSNFGEGRGNRGETYWDAYNGVTEWLDHQRCRSDETRLESTWFGDSARIRNRAHEVALELCS